MSIKTLQTNPLHFIDWELDFYSRPIIETDGKKRWELLITTPDSSDGKEPFRWVKKCPASQVNSIWLTEALSEAIRDSDSLGLSRPRLIRCWRSSMRTMINKASNKVGLEVLSSRRTYTLFEWIEERERDIYPKEEGYISGPVAPPINPILNMPVPLPEAVRGDAWSLSTLSLHVLREANQWPIQFSGLLPIKKVNNESTEVLGLRLFSKKRALALAGWLGGLEPVRLVVEGKQLLLEAAQEDRWLVTDLDEITAQSAKDSFVNSKKNGGGYQFIAIQSSPEEKSFTGFWMLKDIQM